MFWEVFIDKSCVWLLVLRIYRMMQPGGEQRTPTSADEVRQGAEEVCRQLHGAGHEALFAGGCVRDLELGMDPVDFDIATSARPDDVAALFPVRFP